MPNITFVVPVGDEQTLSRCLLVSPVFQGPSDHELLLQRGFRSASAAFNDGIDRASNDLIVCLHQDVVLPEGWPKLFLQKLTELENGTLKTGVVGCAGITRQGAAAGHIYRHDREFHPSVALPGVVETLDELLICFRKSSGLRFDPALPSFFGYAVDICLLSIAKGYQNFVVDAPCFHQAKSREGRLPKQFFINWNYLCAKWRQYLPVQTLTGTLGHRRSFLANNVKEFVRERLGYVPEPWWTRLPIIDPHAAMCGLQPCGRTVQEQ